MTPTTVPTTKPVTIEPVPVTIEPTNTPIKPVPVTIEPTKAPIEPVPVTIEPTKDPIKPVPVTIKPTAPIEPVPVTVKPTTTPGEPVPVTVVPTRDPVKPLPITPATAPAIPTPPEVVWEPVRNVDAPTELTLTKASELSSFGGTDRVAKLVVVLQANPDYYLKITGHANAEAGEGDAEIATRTGNVKAALIKEGINESRILIVAPAKPDPTPEKRYVVSCWVVTKAK
jgi:hypothetical protein